LIFYEGGDKSKPYYGIQCMFNPHNGRLSYNNGQIGILFAHYNHFGSQNGGRNDHTGDTLIILDDNG